MEVYVSLTTSVVIPVWNAVRTIDDCLRSINEQYHSPYEIIIVDDGSDDSTAELCKKFPVRILSTGGRKGPAAARNLGAEKAEGDVILFLDSDVTVPPDLIEKVEHHFEDTSLWALQTLYTPVCPASDSVSLYQNYYYFHSINRIPEENSATFATWCAAVRRNRFLEAGGFNVRIPEPTVEDEELGYTIADSGGKILVDKTIQVTHLASYTLGQFTSRRLRMARAQAKSGWRQIKNRLLARYINVRESGTHHSRWVVLSILLVLVAQLLLVQAALFLNASFLALAAIAYAAAIMCHTGFLIGAGKKLGKRKIPVFTLLCLYDMAVLGWGIIQGTLQYFTGRKY